MNDSTVMATENSTCNNIENIGNNNNNNNNTNNSKIGTTDGFINALKQSIFTVIEQTDQNLVKSLNRTIKHIITINDIQFHISVIDNTSKDLFLSSQGNTGNNRVTNDNEDCPVDDDVENQIISIAEKKTERNKAAVEMNAFFAVFAGANPFIFQDSKRDNRRKKQQAEDNPDWGQNSNSLASVNDLTKIENLLGDLVREREGLSFAVKNVVCVRGDGKLFVDMIDFKNLKRVFSKKFAIIFL